MDGCLFEARGAHQYSTALSVCASTVVCQLPRSHPGWTCGGVSQPVAFHPSLLSEEARGRALRLVRFHAANNGGPLSEIDDLIRQKSTADVFVEVQRDPSWHLVGQLFFTFLLAVRSMYKYVYCYPTVCLTGQGFCWWKDGTDTDTS